MTDILAVDPGGTSGFAMLSGGDLITGEFPFHDMVDWAEKWMYDNYRLGNQAYVVCERFTISQRTVTTAHHDVNWSIETIGALRWLCHRYEHSFGLLNASDCKSFASDELLHVLDWYSPGLGHANDAARVLALAVSQTDPRLWKRLVLGSDLLTEGHHAPPRDRP